MTVLALTTDTDSVADRVIAELALRGVPVVRLDQADIPLRVWLDGRISTGRPWGGRLFGVNGTLVDLADVRAVWHRHTKQFVVDEDMSGPEKAFAYGEARRGYGGILAALSGCLWVNDPMAAARAEYKPVQLAAATAAGLRIPQTLITSDPRTAYDWARQLGRPTIYKPLDGVWHADEGQVRVIYTSPVTDLDELLDPALGKTAHLFQEQIPKAFEARVTVVGSQVFAVRIDAGSPAAREDWRSDYDALAYSQIELPPDVAAGLLGLHQRLGLRYGAADLILDADTGAWTLLEFTDRPAARPVRPASLP
ncbi:MAG: MvdC/MvdD family ATP grasp protein, partial [Streptosporangiaceae bacterium]